MSPSLHNLFLKVFLAVFLMTSPAFAVEINDKGAELLKSTLSEYAENYKNSMQLTGGSLEIDGEITVEQGKNYYAATIPTAKITMFNGEIIKLGLLAINAIPTDKAGDYKMSIAIPTPILITDKDGAPTQQIEIGKQTMGGLWSSSLDNFSKISAHYKNLKFTDVKKNASLNIGKIDIVSDLTENKENKWTGPTKIILSNFSSNDPTTKNDFLMDELQLSINIKNYAHQEYKKTIDKLQSANNPEGNLEFGGVFYDLLKSTGDVAVDFSIKNIKLKESYKKENFESIDLIKFGYASSAPKDDKINQKFNIGYSGLKLSDSMTDKKVIPSQFNISLALENLPLLEIIKFAETAPTDSNGNNARQVVATKAMNFLPQILKEAGTAFTLQHSGFGNEDYNVELDAEVKAEPSSKMGGTGFLNIKTTGLDMIMKELEHSSKGETIIPQLTLFRAVSEEKGDKNIARIKLNKDGKITLNGKDMSALLGGGTPAEEEL